MNYEDIKQILLDQKESVKYELSNGTIIDRECLAEYKSLLSSSLIKIITGPRRAGKSTLAFQLLNDSTFVYVNFDDERISELHTRDLNFILQAIYEIYDDPKYVFFDEIQNITGWELFVNRLKRLNMNLIITGSNAKLLSRELATHLTGRHFALELFPFSFREYLKFNKINCRTNNLSTRDLAKINKHLHSYISNGGFPEVVQGEMPKRYLQTLYSTILTKDILSKYNLKYTKTFRDTANYLLSNCSSLHTFNKIKNIFQYKSVHTAENYVSFLEESYLIFSLTRFSFKDKERLTAPRKIYCIDTGLINSISVKSSNNLGQLYENIVALEFKRKCSKDQNLEIFYWADNSSHEIDFVIKKGLKVIQLVQVCYDIHNPDTLKREIKSLVKSAAYFKCNKLFLINSDTDKIEKIEGHKIIFIPLWKWLIE